MDDVRVGIIGMGGIGVHHGKYLAAGAVGGARLTAVSSRDQGRLEGARREFPGVHGFGDYREMLTADVCDAVIICTPHYQHGEMAREAFGAGRHVLVEKPLAVSVKEGRRLAEEAEKYPKLVFGIMLNQRASPLYQKIRAMLAGGEIGEMTRITWIATHWFRPWAYFASSPWRATWAGEGGGLLINQAYHNLDLMYWLTGKMPRRVMAAGFLGKTHPIETEDEVSAVLEYGEDGRGAVGHFISTTGEGAGVNRLEIAGTRGRLVAEGGELAVHRMAADSREFMKTCVEPFGAPEVKTEAVRVAAGPVPEHKGIVEDFVKTIREGRGSAELLAPGAEGLYGLELSNAMLMAGLTREAVDLPLDGEAFEAFLDGRRKGK